MTTLLITTFTVLAFILPGVSIAIATVATLRQTQTLIASLTWQRLSSVSWNG